MELLRLQLLVEDNVVGLPEALGGRKEQRVLFLPSSGIFRAFAIPVLCFLILDQVHNVIADLRLLLDRFLEAFFIFNFLDGIFLKLLEAEAASLLR